ncbi:immunoglobulin superfamily containing leucine-rich repeat protein 2-like [Nematolebias whitei]|uniref:immunoglobulin superfamily containing leucine-rich repeat protein 2-like n=1 Tax=Nematolebias whitei TaxID=451745 RepID=UPI00189AE0C8|nr:immunoglobulin superfamily containing leucine-rich repeat protein 2-like [Nematolebias whitei]
MAAANIIVLIFLTSTIVSAGLSCPELCVCSDKHGRHFVECSNKHLAEVPGGLPANVTTLSLSSNRISVIPLGSFDNVTKVTSLWMAYNEIVSIQQGSLVPLVHLRNFDISHNGIVDFPWGDLQKLPALQLLKMNHNKMSNLPRDAFSNLKDLRSLRLNDNEFVTLAEGTFDGLVSLSHVQIYNNPFACTCSLDWLRDWILTTIVPVLDQSLISCATPEKLKGELIVKLPTSKCTSPNVTIQTEPNTHMASLYEDGALVLTCEFKGNPKPVVIWNIHSKRQKQEVVLSVSEETSAGSNENSENSVQVFNNGTLFISNIRQEDAGNYSCFATNEIGRAEDTVFVKVIPRPKPKPIKLMTTIFTFTKTNPSRRKQTDNMSLFDFDSNRKDTQIDIPTLAPTTESIMSKYFEEARVLSRSSKCGLTANTKNLSNHVLNESLDDMKQYVFDFGVIALGVSETEATVHLSPLLVPKDRSTNQGAPTTSNSFQTDSEESVDFPDVFNKVHSNGLYLCIAVDGKHSAVQWSQIKEGINAYLFSGLQPGTNYSLCLTYRGEDCEVQVLFATRKRVPNLLIIISVSICLLTVSTVPLLGATCFHLVYKYRSKTYKLILKAKDQYHTERNLNLTLSLRTESRKKITEEDGTTESANDAEKEADTEESVVTESVSMSHCRYNPEDCEVGSEYSDKLPLGAEAMNITSNYKYPND